MAGDNSIIINQSLHGYRGGHKLLSSSVELSDLEKRFMLLMSDYSGSGVEKGFLDYISGYPIPNSKFYVFAKTWYASEMNRPGCVWTHSFLIDVTDLWAIKDMRILLSYFKRPMSETIHDDYSIIKSIPFNSTYLVNEGLNETFYNISCELYNEADLGLVLLATSSVDFENEILQIWNWQWPRLKRSFKFCTGSLSLKKFDDQPFDLQVMPFRRERTLSLVEREIFNIVNLEIKICENEWIGKYRNTNLEILQKHMVKFGSDVLGTRGNYIALFKSFNLLNESSDFKLYAIEKYFNENFILPEQARVLKATIIDTLFRNEGVAGLELIQLLLSSHALSSLKWDYSKIILDLLNRNKVNDEELIEMLSLLIERESIEDQVLDVLQRIPLNKWLDRLEIEEKLISKLLLRSSKYESDFTIWLLDKRKQQKWFNAFEKKNNPNWNVIIESMLQAQSDTFAQQISQIDRSLVIETTIGWVAKFDKRLPSNWFFVLKEYSSEVLGILLSQNSINYELIRMFLELLSPYDEAWMEIEFNIVDRYLSRINQIYMEPEVTGVYTFLMTVCFNNNFSQSELLITNLFQPLHDKFNNHWYDFNSWERFKRDMGRELQGLIEQSYISYFWEDKNQIQDWDRCEFLRRALVAVFLKFKWNPINLARAVKDKYTFEKIVDYGVQINSGFIMFENLYYLLRDSDAGSFHCKVLKNAIR